MNELLFNQNHDIDEAIILANIKFEIENNEEENYIYIENETLK